MSQYAPNEPLSTILKEKGWLQGAILGGVAYGACIILFYICFMLLLELNSSSSTRTRFTMILLTYSTAIFILTTLFMGSLARFTEMAFIENRNYPGGPSSYEVNEFSVTASELGNVSFVIANLLSDAMLVWRCLVIYRGSTVPTWLTVIPPCLAYLGSCVLGIFWLLEISASSPFGAFFAINWTVPYLSTSLGLNMAMTLAIVIRLWIFRRRSAQIIGPAFGTEFTSVSAIMVESAALYSLFSLLFLVPFILNHYISTIFLQSLCQVQTVASLLIVFRVAQGKGWSLSNNNRSDRSKTIPMSVMKFRTYSENPSMLPDLR